MIGAKISGYSGWVTAANKHGQCELCADKPKLHAILHEWQQLHGPARERGRTKAKAAENKLNRVLRDGRPYAPAATAHGTAGAYVNHGCRCTPCSTWKTESNRKAAA